MRSIHQKTYEYNTFFELNEDGGYTVTVPALPGLVTEGADIEDAKSMAKDAIRCYLEAVLKEGNKSSAIRKGEILISV